MTAAARLLAWLRWLRRFTAVLLFGYDGFMSHARADGRAYAIALWAALERLGLTICFDREDFHTGDPLHSTLRRTVRSSRCLILLDTPKARASRWVQDEVVEAIARRRPIVPVQHAEASTVEWQPPPVAAHLATLIHSDETADNFAQGVVRPEITDAIRASLTSWTTRQRFRRAGFALAGAAAVAAGVAVATSLAASRLDALRATLDDPGIPLDQGVDDVRTFLRSGLGRLAITALPGSTDQLLQQAAAARLKLQPLDAAPAGARVSTSDEAVVVLSGSTLQVRTWNQTTSCALPATVPIVAAAVNRRATVVVGVTATSVVAWRVPECRQFAEASLPAEGSPGRGAIGGVRVVGDADDATALVWWNQQLLSLVVGPAGARVEGRLDASAVTDGPGREARFFAVSSGPGTPVAFTAGVVDAMEPDRLCVADSGTLAFGWLCTYEPARSFGFDAGGQFLVWSTIGGPLQVARVASAALGDPFRVEFALTGDIQGLAVGRESAVKLDAAGVATFLDLPSLTVLDTQTIGFTAGQVLVGSARRAGYERTTADTPPTDASVAATCGDRTLARSGSPDAGGAAVRHAGGDWRLALTDVAVPATATVTAAAFGENCGRLLVALEDGIGSDVLAIDIVEPGVFSARRLARRATREVAGRVRELRFDGTARGWATALVETTGDPRSLVLQRVPIERSAVLEQLEVDRHASRSSVALVAGR